jgi:hypothetical protein
LMRATWMPKPQRLECQPDRKRSELHGVGDHRDLTVEGSARRAGLGVRRAGPSLVGIYGAAGGGKIRTRSGPWGG